MAEAPASSKINWPKELFEWLKTAGIAFVIVLALHLFVFNLSTVEGHSMEPTLRDKEWLFVNKVVYKARSPKAGDVIIIKDPLDVRMGLSKPELLVKRVVGVPGDQIEIYNKKLYRNGQLVNEPYIDTVIEGHDYGPHIVEKGSYFVLGDNRHAQASKDSRVFGTVPEALIQGKADFIVWPLNQMTML
ncbi:signal peptidase I [Paenibacillus protaetiae]|uniref:Signal peptidase I n=2 Tax=Paenibacillus protaetiae TaxID=2509456 RepID=A0A4P6F2V9_9BACL|nr:signal peptidase I [Paenibacillus protaetiae]